MTGKAIVKRPPDRIVALHEGGHAVASVVLGCGCRGVELCAGGELLGLASTAALGRAEAFRPDVGLSTRQRHRLEAQMIVFLAGREAERRAKWRCDRGNGEDLAAAVTSAEALSASRAEAAALVELQRIRAAQLVRVWWRAVRAVAVELEQRKRLSGREVRAIVRTIPLNR